MNTPKRTAVSNLLQAGLEEAKKVKEIKSVATTGLSTSDFIQESISEEENVSEADNITVQKNLENAKETIKKGIEHIFADRKINNTEGVRIPAEFHKELKVLAGLSGCTIVQMLGNILEDFLNENQKAISSYKRKMI